ncbi:response regulator [Aureimonas psammosilenae]|uniref:response regulator n=1 Tax=Aureimonas psammosilenae TaxID=2495496 RepID=UPI00126077C2|nr:response regulator [Aureimonas psammosilenae]
MTASNRPSPFAVLVVDDEPLLRMDAMDLAEEAGLRAYEASNADEAIALLEKHDDIRILFTDIQMKGSMDGLKLAHAVRNRWPPVRIMVTSGVIEVTEDLMPENGLFFAKPYPPRFLIETMRNAAAEIVF